MLWANKGCIYDTSQGASPLLCSWQTFGSCEVLIASKPKRTVTPLCIYVHPTFAQLELPVRIWHRKSNNYYRNNKTFSKKVSKKVVWWGIIIKRRGISSTWFFQQKGGSLEGSTQAIKNQQIYARINLFPRKKYQSLIFRCRIRHIYLIHRTLSRMRLLKKWREKYHRSIIN